MTLIAEKREEEALAYLRMVQGCAHTFASYGKSWLTVV